jgi:hypothetical protein
MASESFEIVGQIRAVEIIASGRRIRDLTQLQERFGGGNWRNSRALLPFGSRTVRLLKLRSIGTRVTESVSAG